MKMYTKICWFSFCGVVGMIMLGATLSMASLFSSTFDADAERWSIFAVEPDGSISGTYPVYWSASGGLPGGLIYSPDVGSSTSAYSFAAPSEYLGDKTAYVGGTFSFDIKNSFANYNGGESFYNTFIKGAGVTLTHKGPYPRIANSWQHAEAQLNAASWTQIIDESNWNGVVTPEMFSTVMANLEGIYIYADWGWGADTAYLDNVSLSLVPEPISMLLFGTGLVGIGGYVRKKIKQR